MPASLAMLHSVFLDDPVTKIGLAAIGVFLVVGWVFILGSSDHRYFGRLTSSLHGYGRFVYGCFLKPHSRRASKNQQDALESFYMAQASVYDATRMRLLKGREDMLGLVAAQLKNRMASGQISQKPVWVDIGGGTGYNIEQMADFIDVPNTFQAVYLVDLSTSLCKVAEERFQRLGWKNVHVLCQDARSFNLADHSPAWKQSSEKGSAPRADVLTMSYSLSMIPEFYSVIDSLANLLSPTGIIGVSDFYVQSEVDYQSRNYIGGEINRHCVWISRVFWRTWFEVDRVNLEAARRDYLEYKFGTVLSFNDRCKLLGLRIPYYVWLGCAKASSSTALQLAELDASVTESPFLSALDLQSKRVEDAERSSMVEIRSKAYESAVVNLAASLPLPASWYQTHHWRIYYDDTLQKHRQFNDEYIYAFNWEDAAADARILRIQEHDVILAITSAGDQILSYSLDRPKRIHSVDLNPSQNHLLELKIAAFTALPYADVWKMFGDGVHPNFRSILINKLSPHMSSLAFQYWLHKGSKTFSGRGLYFTGGSRHALNLCAWLFGLLGLKGEVKRMCSAQTLNEQKEIWNKSIRGVVLSRLLSWGIVSSKTWLWKALGVPAAQRQLIEQDWLAQDDPQPDSPSRSRSSSVASTPVGSPTMSPLNEHSKPKPMPTRTSLGRAIWNYAVQTLDPVVSNTLLSTQNHYYLLPMLGHYTQACHPAYLSPRAHTALSKPNAFNGLRIHTDELSEVLTRMTPGSLTIAVVMDSMDWFDENTESGQVEALKEVRELCRALKMGGRVMLRSAGLAPWYVRVFEANGFVAKRVARRAMGNCMDRVNMYASTWLLTKVAEPGKPGASQGGGDMIAARARAGALEPLKI